MATLFLVASLLALVWMALHFAIAPLMREAKLAEENFTKSRHYWR